MMGWVLQVFTSNSWVPSSTKLVMYSCVPSQDMTLTLDKMIPDFLIFMIQKPTPFSYSTLGIQQISDEGH